MKNLAEITTANKLFWAWNGDLTEKEIRRQIADFRQKGFGGFFMHARGGLTVPYMGEQWMQAVSAAIDEAKKQGLEAWLYDEDGWPSGFGGGEVNGKGDAYCQKTLTFADPSHLLAKYVRCDAAVPPKADDRYACFAAAKYRLAEESEAGELICGYEVNPYYADVFCSAATDAFISCTHEKYYARFGAEFGHTVKGIFTDEPQYGAMPYSPELTAYFIELHGYDPLPWLYLLREDGAAGKVFRTDYYGAVCKRFAQNYVRKVSDWCARHGLHMTGHFPEEDGVSTQFLKGGDTMLDYVPMSYPGIDFLGRRLTSPVLCKQISSVKHQLRKRHVLSETFGCTGWNTALWQYKWIWGYQSILGIDTACMHLAAYTIRGVRKRDYPAFFSYQSSWWTRADELNAFMRALNDFSQYGEPIEDVLLLSPVTDAYGERAHSDEAGEISTQFRTIVEALLDLQIPFDVADENYLQAVPHDAGDGVATVGHMRYRVLLVPPMRSICGETKRFIEQAARCGVTVAFTGGKPQTCDGVPAAWADEWSKYPYGGVVQNRRALWEKYFAYIHYERAACVTNEDDSLCRGLYTRVRAEKGKRYVAVFNPDAHASRRGILRIAGTGTVYAVSIRGEKENVTQGCDGKYTRASLTVAAGETALYIWEEGKPEFVAPLCVKRVVSPTPLSSALCDENVLTIDTAALSVMGGAYGEPRYVLHLQEEVHALSAQGTAPKIAEVRYRFRVRDLPRSLYLCCETATADGVTCNGTPLEIGKDTFIDASIARTDISSLVCEGENEIVLHYTVQPRKCAFDPHTVFESEKNRFSYGAEIESVYLTGDFDVAFEGKMTETPAYYRVDGGEFVLVKPRPKDFDAELTRQGLWFYRGNVRRDFSYDYTDGRVWLKAADAAGVLTEVHVNGAYAGCVSGASSIEITALLHAGENHVQTVLYGSNRNALGPHHHYKGEQNFVGVNTFRGTRGYEDEVVTVDAPKDTYVPSYAFVPLRAGKIYCIEKK